MKIPFLDKFSGGKVAGGPRPEETTRLKIGELALPEPQDNPRDGEDATTLTRKESDSSPVAVAARKPRKKRKPQSTFGRVYRDRHWIEQRKDGLYVRRRYARKWEVVPFAKIIDHVTGQMPLV